jgi:hypothetical protein
MDLSTRQDYYDVSPDQATRIGCDVVQLKYDGWWCRLAVDILGNWNMYSRTGRRLKNGTTHPSACGLYIGEYMFGTQWAQDPARKEKLFLFDCWQRGDTEITDFPYRDRFALLKIAKQSLPDWCVLVDNYPISETNKLWETYVEKGNFEGLIFRTSRDSAIQKIYRHKKTITDTYKVVGVEVGEGKYEKTLGALLCTTPDGKHAKVGTGFTDDFRHLIWTNAKDYIGKFIEVEGKARFDDTGLLRHPVFVRIEDKD